jgi:signal transduction histidine kinase
MENSLNQLIFKSRKIAYAITDRELIVQELHGQPELIDTLMERCLGCPLTEIFPELIGNQQDLDDILAGKLSNLQLVYVNRESQGKTIYLTMDDLPYKDESGKIMGIVHVVQDETSKGELEQQITQNRNELRLLMEKVSKLNLELMATNSELKRLSEFKAQFVHLATSELKGQLKSLNAYIKMLLEGQLGPLNANQTETLKIVQNNGLRVKSMTNELLNAVRLESGQIELQLTPTNLVELVNAVVSENAAQIEARKQALNLEFSPELPPALCDEDWTKQIVSNLLSNAGKYTPEGGRISIRVKLADQAGFLQLSVADTGAGIPEKEQSEIFSVKFESERITSQSTQSPGKGLYITRTLVELNGGKIWFETQPNVGSVFHVTLPIAS